MQFSDMDEKNTTTLSSRAMVSAADATRCFTGTRNQFIEKMLAAMCDLSSASNGAVLLFKAPDSVQLTNIYPPLENPNTTPPWIIQAGDLLPQVIQSGQSATSPLHGTHDLYGQAPNEHIILLPLAQIDRTVPQVAIFLVRNTDLTVVMEAQQRLDFTSKLLNFYDVESQVYQRAEDLERIRTVMEMVASVGAVDGFKQSAMALCNDAATRFGAERASLGLLCGRYVKLCAMSHQDKFTRKMRAVQELESVMEECIDQNVEVVHPAPETASYVSRVASQMAMHEGSRAIISLPLRRSAPNAVHTKNNDWIAEPKAVLTLERDANRPFTADEGETLRLAADMCSGWVINLFENDRWIGRKVVASCRNGLAKLVGPQHTWIKLAAIGFFALMVFLMFGKGVYRVKGSFVAKLPTLQIITAPYDGYLDQVFVKIGDPVIRDQTILATLSADDLYEQLSSAKAKRLEYKKAADIKGSQGNIAEQQMALAKLDSIEAEIHLLESRLNRCEIRSPTSGTIISGDLDSMRGAPVETGQELFEVAPLDALYAEISISEKRISDVKIGDTGYLAAAARPSKYINFQVEKIDKVAKVVDQKVLFNVRGRLFFEPEDLSMTHSWLLSGMEGVAKVDINKRTYLWIWTSDLINWIRMRLWI